MDPKIFFISKFWIPRLCDRYYLKMRKQNQSLNVSFNHFDYEFFFWFLYKVVDEDASFICSVDMALL